MKLLTTSKALKEELAKINITRSEELLEYLPYRYEEFFLSPNEGFFDKQRVVILGKVVSSPRTFKKGSLSIITFHVIDTYDHLYTCKIFNRPFYLNMLEFGEFLTISGTYSSKNKEINVINIKKGELEASEKIKPVYHLPSGILQGNYLKLVKKTLDDPDVVVQEVLPPNLKEKYRLLDHKEALKKVHTPLKKSDIQEGLRTLKFEECLEYSFKNKLIRLKNQKIIKRTSFDFDLKLINSFIVNLPYKLTHDQVKSIQEIILNIKSEHVMYRLLQGDVGTGKTIVAIIALYANYLSQRQGVLLAPTDSLARQHYENVVKELAPYDIKVGLLIGDMKPKDKALIKEQIKNNQIDVIVGTHAVFSQDVVYDNLGLAIIDEQHRFGVNQRNTLVNKGEDVDLLLMSATPIPRTLALSIYGDLDVSTLETYPHKERDVTTRVVDYNSPKIEGMIDFLLKEDKQVFIVCPKIHLGGSNKSSEEVYQELLPKYGNKIALLHGQLPSEEKNSILEDFKNNQIKILVSTTVIELGIDISNASGIIIYSANSFGLASLHQLRGRVGRDGSKAYCLLVDDLKEETHERLKFLETCSNGFAISEEDMRLRGPGDFIGLEQSGFPDFNALNIVSDFRMFEVARDEVKNILANLNDPNNQKYYTYIENKMESESLVSLLD